MATARDIVRGAYLRLGLIRANQQPTAADAEIGVLALNDMMFAWANDGVDVDHVALALADNFPLAFRFHQGVKAMLAIRLAEENGDDVRPQVASDAANGWSALQAEFISAPKACFDLGMSLRHRWCSCEDEAEDDDSGGGSDSNWILADGAWNDAGLWIDTESWNDA